MRITDLLKIHFLLQGFSAFGAAFVRLLCKDDQRQVKKSGKRDLNKDWKCNRQGFKKQVQRGHTGDRANKRTKYQIKQGGGKSADA